LQFKFWTKNTNNFFSFSKYSYIPFIAEEVPLAFAIGKEAKTGITLHHVLTFFISIHNMLKFMRDINSANLKVWKPADTGYFSEIPAE
jgi:hypothetical protein